MDDSSLQPVFTELKDALADLRTASAASFQGTLHRLVTLLDQRPLSDFIAAAVPAMDFDTWWKRVGTPASAMAGACSLDWPTERGARVGIQIGLCRALSDGRVQFHLLAMRHLYVGTPNISAHVRQFAEVVVAPMLRDLHRLAESRTLPMPLAHSMQGMPSSEDGTVDDLLRQAIDNFRDPSPGKRRAATERLWDAWERLKTLDDARDKRRSVAALLDRAADEQAFRTVLETEARALTQIGNQFHIRHFERDRQALVRVEHYDYLFHRLWALIELLLRARTR